MEIKIEVYSDWKKEVDDKKLKHFSYKIDGDYILMAIDGPLNFTHHLDDDDVISYEELYLPSANRRVGQATEKSPFDSKQLADGRKLYRRKHGIRKLIDGNGSGKISFTVPYGVCKIDEVEIVNCSGIDTINLSVVDDNIGSYSGYPNVVLNQFGFNVNLSDLYYVDTSNYDATLLIGMIIEVDYVNNEADAKDIGVNFTLHEVK